MQADVRSIAAIHEWLANLKLYREAANGTLVGVEMEIRRGLDWVAEQGSLWAKAAKESEQELWQAKQDLNARKTPNWDGREPDTTVQERAVRRAAARLEHAQEQIQKCRQWLQKLPRHIDETYRGASNRLNLILEGDLARAMALLEKQVASLEAYAGLRPDFAPAPIVTTELGS
jgi:hypothetical protein